MNAKKKNLAATIGIESKVLDAYAKNVTAEINTHRLCLLNTSENIFLNEWLSIS